VCLIDRKGENPNTETIIKKRRKFMDFEKAYQNFLNGTATPEETEFVRSEMKKASEVNDILNNVKKDGATNDAEENAVKRAMKEYRKRDTGKILGIVCAALIVLSIVISASIGIPILVNAGENNTLSKAEAEDIAVQYLAERHPDSAENIRVHRVERELEVEGRIKNAHYVYVVEIYNGKDNVIEIEIDGRNGSIIDVDAD
jgi:uncharacterized membrane protein YkoI